MVDRLELLRPGHPEAASRDDALPPRARPQLRITLETAQTFGILAAKIRKAGKDPDVRVNDLWFAAQAVQREFRLLTSNAKDFVDVPGLQLVVLKRHS